MVHYPRHWLVTGLMMIGYEKKVDEVIGLQID